MWTIAMCGNYIDGNLCHRLRWTEPIAGQRIHAGIYGEKLVVRLGRPGFCRVVLPNWRLVRSVDPNQIIAVHTGA